MILRQSFLAREFFDGKGISSEDREKLSPEEIDSRSEKALEILQSYAYLFFADVSKVEMELRNFSSRYQLWQRENPFYYESHYKTNVRNVHRRLLQGIMAIFSVDKFELKFHQIFR